MSHWAGGWAPYVPVAERRRKAVRAMEQRRKAGHPVAPVTIIGRAIATTFWGTAWCDNIESYRDFESRLPRGRTYVRSGAVVDLQISPGHIEAIVCGSELYDVSVTITETPKTRWRSICADCAGGIDSVVELLQGQFSRAVMQRLCRQQGGLFPRPSEIRFSCSCPDYAGMCKHVAAVLYGVGARLDHQPELLFRLRAVDETDLVAQAGAGLKLATRPPGSGRMLRTDDVAALFGLDIAGGEPGSAGDGGPATAGGTGRSRRKVSKTAATPTRERKTAAAGPTPRSPAEAHSRQETPAKAASKPAAARGGSTPGLTAPAVNKAVNRRAKGTHYWRPKGTPR